MEQLNLLNAINCAIYSPHARHIDFIPQRPNDTQWRTHYTRTMTLIVQLNLFIINLLLFLFYDCIMLCAMGAHAVRINRWTLRGRIKEQNYVT